MHTCCAAKDSRRLAATDDEWYIVLRYCGATIGIGADEIILSRLTTPVIVSTCMGCGAEPDTGTDMLLRACSRNDSVRALTQTYHHSAKC